MSTHFISTLLDLKGHFPEMMWSLDEENGTLDITAPLGPEEIAFLLAARTMFEPAFPQTEDEARICSHGNRVWFGHECGLCE